MPPVIGLRTNRRLHYWGPNKDFVVEVVARKCPTVFTFDNSELTFDSSCRIFDNNKNEVFSFDSLNYNFSGAMPIMDDN